MRTISCEESRELLLRAEPEVLRAQGAANPRAQSAAGGRGQAAPAGFDALLREHLRNCRECSSLAAAILAENAALDTALAQLTPQRAEVRPTPPVGAVRPLPKLAARPRHARWPALLIPLAAAAALVLVWRPWPTGPDALPPLTGPAEQVPAAPVVNAATGRGVAVMRTNDPNITVIWTF